MKRSRNRPLNFDVVRVSSWWCSHLIFLLCFRVVNVNVYVVLFVRSDVLWQMVLCQRRDSFTSISCQCSRLFLSFITTTFDCGIEIQFDRMWIGWVCVCGNQNAIESKSHSAMCMHLLYFTRSRTDKAFLKWYICDDSVHRTSERVNGQWTMTQMVQKRFESICVRSCTCPFGKLSSRFSI